VVAVQYQGATVATGKSTLPYGAVELVWTGEEKAEGKEKAGREGGLSPGAGLSGVVDRAKGVTRE